MTCEYAIVSQVETVRVAHVTLVVAIGVASYGALGHVPLSTSDCVIFQGTSEPHKL